MYLGLHPKFHGKLKAFPNSSETLNGDLGTTIESRMLITNMHIKSATGTSQKSSGRSKFAKSGLCFVSASDRLWTVPQWPSGNGLASKATSRGFASRWCGNFCFVSHEGFYSDFRNFPSIRLGEASRSNRFLDRFSQTSTTQNSSGRSP